MNHGLMRRYLVIPLLAMSVASCAAPIPPPALPAPVQTAPPAIPAPPVPLPLAVAPSPPAEQPFFTQQGIASFYGKKHQGRRTAAGEHFDLKDFTAAHRTLAFGTVVRVTNLRNGETVKVRINDRGPHVKGRIIDLSTAAARAIGIWDGVARVRIEVFASEQRGS